MQLYNNICHIIATIYATATKQLTKLTMYFTINLAFPNYLELMPNITDQLTFNQRQNKS